MQLAADRLELAQVRGQQAGLVGGQLRAGLVVELHLGVDQLADAGQGGGQELVGELDSGVGLVFLPADVDLLQDVLAQEVLKPQFAVALAHQLGIPLRQFYIVRTARYPNNDDGLQNNKTHLILQVQLF